MTELTELLRRWDSLPSAAIVNAKVAAAVLSLSERSIRYHENLPRIYLARTRYGFRKSDIEKILNGESAVPLRVADRDSGAIGGGGNERRR
jgi:hypothetical protein